MKLTRGMHNPKAILAPGADFWRIVMETVTPLITTYAGGPGSRNITISEHSIWAPNGEWRPRQKEDR